MTTTRQSWEDAGAKLSGLALKLKYHFEEEHSEEVAEHPEVRSEFQRFSQALDDAFDALANATKDEAVKADVAEAAHLLRHALSDTFAEAGDVLRRTFANKQ